MNHSLMITMLIPAAGPPEGRDSRGEGAGQHIIDHAKQLVAKALLPEKITSTEIERYYRKAHRVRAWPHLKKWERALLYLARKLVTEAKSYLLQKALKQIFLEIALHTLKGRALLQGMIIHLKAGGSANPDKLNHKHVYLLALGINYLNNPPIYRVNG